MLLAQQTRRSQEQPAYQTQWSSPGMAYDTAKAATELPLHPETRNASEHCSRCPGFSTPAHTAATGGHDADGHGRPQDRTSRAGLTSRSCPAGYRAAPARPPSLLRPPCSQEQRDKRTSSRDAAALSGPFRPPPPARPLCSPREPCRWRKQVLPLPRGQALFFHHFLLEDSISGVGMKAPTPLS